MPKPPVIQVLPRTSLYAKLFAPETTALLNSLGTVRRNATDKELTSAELTAGIADVDVLITGWGSPKLTPELLAHAKNLRLVAHSAGSVKFMLDEALLARGIKVSTAGAAMVTPVSEMTCMLCLLMLRPLHKMDAALRAGQGSWSELKTIGVGDELASQSIGVVGAGQIGRRVIDMLRAWNLTVNVFDPFYTPEKAAAVGATYCPTLQDLMSRSRIVTLHAPILPDTHHMIGAKELAAMKDGSILINTARAWLVDMPALEKELRAGRLSAATDVFDTEPLPANDPWRSMPNTFITPHLASYTTQCFHRQAQIAVEETERFLTGQPLKYEVTPALLKVMA